jgi:hypothetical protein
MAEQATSAVFDPLLRGTVHERSHLSRASRPLPLPSSHALQIRNLEREIKTTGSNSAHSVDPIAPRPLRQLYMWDGRSELPSPKGCVDC